MALHVLCTQAMSMQIGGRVSAGMASHEQQSSTNLQSPSSSHCSGGMPSSAVSLVSGRVVVLIDPLSAVSLV